MLQAGNETKALEIFEEVLTTEPTNSNALVQTAIKGISNPSVSRDSYSRIARAFENGTPFKLTTECQEGLILSALSAKYHIQRDEYESARKFYQKCVSSSLSSKTTMKIQLVTLMPPYVRSCEDARVWRERFNHGIDDLLNQVYCRYMLRCSQKSYRGSSAKIPSVVVLSSQLCPVPFITKFTWTQIFMHLLQSTVHAIGTL